MVGLVGRAVISWNASLLLKCLSRPDWAPGPRAEEGNTRDKRHRYYDADNMSSHIGVIRATLWTLGIVQNHAQKGRKGPLPLLLSWPS